MLDSLWEPRRTTAAKQSEVPSKKKEKRGNIFFYVSLRPVLFFCYNKEEPILNVTPQKRNNIYCSFFLEHASAKYYALTVRSGHKKDHVAVSFYLFYLK